jgi:hypothetical protein
MKLILYNLSLKKFLSLIEDRINQKRLIYKMQSLLQLRL